MKSGKFNQAEVKDQPEGEMTEAAAVSRNLGLTPPAGRRNKTKEDGHRLNKSCCGCAVASAAAVAVVACGRA